MSKFEDGSYPCLPGPALIAKVLAGRCLMNYTRAAVGQGIIPEDVSPKSLTEPPDYVMDAKIAAVTNPVDGECQVTVQIKSDDVKTGFYAMGILLYAEDPDLGEVPYTYLKMEDGLEWIRPASSAIGKLATFDLIAAVGAVDKVSANIDPEALVTVEAVKTMISEHERNPDAHADLLKQYVKAGEPGEPGSALILDDDGKIPDTALPDDIVRPGEDGKIDSSLLPDDVFSQNGVPAFLITIPAGAWAPDADGPCAYRAEVACEDATEAHIPYVSLDGPSAETARSCGFCDFAEAADGVLRFWAESVPPGDIIARAALFGPGGGGGGSGGGGNQTYQFGHGLKQMGNLVSVDTADGFGGDNTLPITAAAVQAAVGDIEKALEKI